MLNTGKAHNVQVSIAQEAIGASIVKAESGGDTSATHTNSDGSIDRGMWQINSKAHPDLSAASAFNPQAATEYVYTITDGFKATQFARIWVTNKGVPSKGLNPTNIASAQTDIVTGIASGGGGDIGTTVSDPGKTITDAGKGVTDIVDTITALPDAALALLRKLLDPTFWKRIGIGTLGVAILIVAIILVFKKPIVEATKAAAA